MEHNYKRFRHASPRVVGLRSFRVRSAGRGAFSTYLPTGTGTGAGTTTVQLHAIVLTDRVVSRACRAPGYLVLDCTLRKRGVYGIVYVVPPGLNSTAVIDATC